MTSPAWEELEREAGEVYADLIARHATKVIRRLKAQAGSGGKGGLLISASSSAKTVTVKSYVEEQDP